jgi:ferredoxin-type protein NapG
MGALFPKTSPCHSSRVQDKKREKLTNRVNSLLTRRAFVELAGKGGIVLALAGLMHFLGSKREFVRPPGAAPEEEFLSLCIRCDRCREACPYGLISPVPITESVISAGTPRLQGYCPLCWRCVAACPTDALAYYQ